MADIPVTSDEDHAGNKIKNAALDPRADTPATPVTGQAWFKDGRLRIFDGTNEKALGYTDDQGGAVTPADFDAQSILAAIVDDTPVAQVIAEQNLYGRITGGDVGPLTVTQVLTMLGVQAGATAPETGEEILTKLLAVDGDGSGLDADQLGGVAWDQYATKAYADATGSGSQLLAGGPVRLATTGPITLSGHQTIDGELTGEDDRVLVKDQVTESTRGVFLAKSGAWQRATDANTDTELSLAIVSVQEGTVNAGSSWRQTTAAPFTIDVDDVIWVFAGSTFIPAGFITNAMLDDQTIVRKRVYTIGDGVLSTIVQAHDLNTKDVRCSLRRTSDDALEGQAAFFATTTGSVTVDFGTDVPAVGEYVLIIEG